MRATSKSKQEQAEAGGGGVGAGAVAVAGLNMWQGPRRGRGLDEEKCPERNGHRPWFVGRSVGNVGLCNRRKLELHLDPSTHVTRALLWLGFSPANNGSGYSWTAGVEVDEKSEAKVTWICCGGLRWRAGKWISRQSGLPYASSPYAFDRWLTAVAVRGERG